MVGDDYGDLGDFVDDWVYTVLKTCYRTEKMP